MKPPFALARQMGLAFAIQRRRRGMTQSEAAERADMSLKYYGEIERGEVNFTVETAEKIANALGGDPVSLFSEQPPPMAVTVQEALTTRIDELSRLALNLLDFVKAFKLTTGASAPELLALAARVVELEHGRTLGGPRPSAQNNRTLSFGDGQCRHLRPSHSTRCLTRQPRSSAPARRR